MTQGGGVAKQRNESKEAFGQERVRMSRHTSMNVSNELASVNPTQR